MAAYVIDLLCVVVLALAVSVLLAKSSSLVASMFGDLVSGIPEMLPESGSALEMEAVQHFAFFFVLAIVAIQLGVECIYFVCFERLWHGQSPGKRVLKLRVVSDDGGTVTTPQSLARNLLRIVDILPAYYIVGFTSMLSSANGKRLGDWVAETIVIRLDRPQAAQPIDDQPQAGDDAFVFAADQLRRIGPTEVALIRRTLRHLGTGKPQVDERLLASAATALAGRIRFSGLSPGQRAAFLRALHRAAMLHR